jgi:hypothetical protein
MRVGDFGVCKLCLFVVCFLLVIFIGVSVYLWGKEQAEDIGAKRQMAFVRTGAWRTP